MDDERAIDDVIATFFEAFTADDRCDARLDALPASFAPGASITRVLDGEVARYDVEGFIRPRRELLTSGRLVGFREWETSGRTEKYGDIAQHWCTYAKGWTEDGSPRTGAGTKSVQLVRLDGAWLISAVIWSDEPG